MRRLIQILGFPFLNFTNAAVHSDRWMAAMGSVHDVNNLAVQ